MGGGTNGPVYAVAGYGRTLCILLPSSPALYPLLFLYNFFLKIQDAGGAFTELNGTSVTNLAAWDTVNATWTKFGMLSLLLFSSSEYTASFIY